MWLSSGSLERQSDVPADLAAALWEVLKDRMREQQNGVATHTEQNPDFNVWPDVYM